MGGVCFAAEDDEVRYRHPSEGGHGYLPPMGHPYAHPAGRPLPPRPVGPPPPRPGQGRFVDEREFMDQKYRRPDYDPRAGPGPTGFQQERDVFGGRGMRPDKMREFGVPPSEDSTIPPFNHSNSQPPHPNFGEPRQHQPYHQHSPQRKQKSPQRPRKSPSNRPGYENHDDHMDGYDSPERKTSGHFPPERKMSGHFPSERKNSGHFSTERPSSGHLSTERQNSGHFSTERQNSAHSGHFAYSDHEEVPRRKSLSERLKNYQRKHTEEDYGGYSKSADRPDNGTDEDFGHNAQLQRKKSLQERVAEFKEKRKNSQHMERQGSDRSDESRRVSTRNKSKERRGYGFERPSPTQGRSDRSDSRKKSKRNSDRHRDDNYADKPRRQTRKPKDRNGHSPQQHSPNGRDSELDRSNSGSGKRRSFIGRPKKSKEMRDMEEVVRRISRRSNQRRAEEDLHGKKFTFDDSPKRRTSRRNNHDHEWAIHE